MKLIRFTSLVVGVVLLLTVGIVWAEAPDQASTGSLSGHVLGVIEVDKTPELIAQLSLLSGEERAEMAKLGWVETKTQLTREGGLADVTVSVGDQKAEADENGYYSLAGLRAGQHTLTVDFAGQVLTTQSVIIQSGRARIKDIYALTITPGHHHSEEGDSAENAKLYLPCYDCNGPFSNCGSPSHVISYSGPGNVYFILSDCDRAFFAAGCWRDFTSNPYCNGSRNCSPKIGHSTVHHCH